MLRLKNITKDYVSGDQTVRANDDISLSFRENEFVAILGQSGCGKSTLLNIIGGLDQYTSGDLIINGKSTKDFKDADWDTYRNHSVGFVFQSYNLIPHQTVVENVELALTLSGVSKKERHQRAVEALEKVGLKEQINKLPSQMSGGQMQRVSVARALVNNPDIILADEPTGALDSKTSVEVMELLQSISHDKLIIMVTHNPELAQRYATRIVRLADGKIIEDTRPFEPTETDFKTEKIKAEEERKKGKKPSMSFATSFMLSLKNLLTKKGRTIMTAFAGSIGIMGIALILALSNGITGFINKVESDALLVMPMSIEQDSMNMDNALEQIVGVADSITNCQHDRDKVYVNSSFSELISSFIAQSKSNNISAFKKYIDKNKDKFDSLCTDIQYKYSTPVNIFSADTKNGVNQVNPNNMLTEMMGDNASLDGLGGFIDIASYTNLWQQLIGDNESLDTHYNLVYGRMPEKFNEVVLTVDKNNEIPDLMLYSLGIKNQGEFQSDMMNLITGKNESADQIKGEYSYDDILNMKFKLLLTSQMMSKDSKTGLWKDNSKNNLFIKNALEKDAVDINIVGIIRPKDDNVLSVGAGMVGYTAELAQYVMDKTKESPVVKEQLSNMKKDVLTGEKFVDLDVNDFDLADIDLNKIDYNKLDITPFMSMADTIDMSQVDITDMSSMFNFKNVTDLQKKLMEGFLTDEQVLAFKQAYVDTMKDKCSIENTFKTIGYCDEDEPTSISIYPKDFDSKAELKSMIDFYNDQVSKDEHPGLEIRPTDYIGIVMDLVLNIVGIVTNTLIIFVAISLVVSSIMIGIITYVSVIERKKEIGILRAIGASKSDISNIFNAETFITGLSSGVLGIAITYLLCIPIDAILKALTGFTVTAVLPASNALILVLISVILSLIAGFVPAKSAARKDPVECLRTE